MRFLADRGIVRLAGRAQRRGVVANHYQLTDRGDCHAESADRIAATIRSTD